MTVQPFSRRDYVANILCETLAPVVGQFMDLWPAPGGVRRVPLVSSPVALELVASGATDTLLGTGANSVTIRLLDKNLDILDVTVDLDGTTPVPVDLGVNWLRSNGMFVKTAGAYGFVEGATITLQEIGGGAVWRQMLLDTNEDRSGVITVPAHFTGHVTAWDLVLRNKKATDTVEGELQFRKPGEAWRIVDFAPDLDETDPVYRATPFLASQRTPAGTDFRLTVRATGTPDRIAGGMSVVMETV